MPQIKAYETGPLEIRPTEIGVEATAAAARRGGAFFNAAAQATSSIGQHIGSAIQAVGTEAVNQVTAHQISHGAATFATISDDITNKWNETFQNADPNDPAVAAKFRETVLEPALAKWNTGFNTDAGQKWAEQHVEHLRSHMFEKTSADMMSLAKKAVTVNEAQTRNQLSNTVMNDPSSLDFALNTYGSSLNGMVDSQPNIKGIDAASAKLELGEKGREQIVKSAAFGYIMKTGQVPPWATDPKYSKYINGIEYKQFEQTARYYQHVGQGEQRAQRQEADRKAKDDFNAQVNQIESDMLPQRPGDKPQVPQDVFDRLRKLAIHPGAGLEPGRLAATIKQVEAVTDRVNKPEPLARVSHDTTMGLLTRMRATDQSRLTDNGPIYEAYQKGDLSNADFHFLVGEFNNLRTPEGMALEKDRTNFVRTYARLIDGMMNDAGIHSMLGSQKMYQFEMDARRQEAQLRKDGKDPHLVYDPRSPEFWGRPENVARYRVSMQDAQAYEKSLKDADAKRAAATATQDAAAAAASPATGFAPPKDWQWSPSRRQYRDAEGNVYDDHGKPIKKK